MTSEFFFVDVLAGDLAAFFLAGDFFVAGVFRATVLVLAAFFAGVFFAAGRPVVVRFFFAVPSLGAVFFALAFFAAMVVLVRG